MLLVLVFAGLEATHAHYDALRGQNSAPCAFCASVHANTPVITVHPLPALHAVEMVAIPSPTEGKSVAPQLTLFIRPPPVV
ncbi:MAG TPA: hypothetical protein VI488_03050 [Candidatus Angelobacter sp.]